MVRGDGSVVRQWERVGSREWRVSNPGASKADVRRKRFRDGWVVTLNGERLRGLGGGDVFASEVDAIRVAEDALNERNRLIGLSMLGAMMQEWVDA